MMEGERTDDRETPGEAAFNAAFDRVFGDGDAVGTAPEATETAVGDDAPRDGDAVAGSPAEAEDALSAAAFHVTDQEAGTQDEPAPGEATDGPAAMERLRRHARTTEGRLAALQAEKAALQDELDTLRVAGSEAGSAPPAVSDAPAQAASAAESPAVTLPEDLARDAEEFDALYPDLAPLLRRPGPAGDRLRRVLRDSGPDMASLAAEAMQSRGVASERIDSLEQRIATRTRQEHLSRIAGQHPEVRGLLTGDPGELASARNYVSGLTTWIEGLPYREAATRLRVLREGTADEVNDLLAAYKTAQTPPPGTGLDADTRRRASEAAGVDNSRGKAPPVVRTPKERANEAWDRIFGE